MEILFRAMNGQPHHIFFLKALFQLYWRSVIFQHLENIFKSGSFKVLTFIKREKKQVAHIELVRFRSYNELCQT